MDSCLLRWSLEAAAPAPGARGGHEDKGGEDEGEGERGLRSDCGGANGRDELLARARAAFRSAQEALMADDEAVEACLDRISPHATAVEALKGCSRGPLTLASTLPTGLGQRVLRRCGLLADSRAAPDLDELDLVFAPSWAAAVSSVVSRAAAGGGRVQLVTGNLARLEQLVELEDMEMWEQAEAAEGRAGGTGWAGGNGGEEHGRSGIGQAPGACPERGPAEERAEGLSSYAPSPRAADGHRDRGSRSKAGSSSCGASGQGSQQGSSSGDRGTRAGSCSSASVAVREGRSETLGGRRSGAPDSRRQGVQGGPEPAELPSRLDAQVPPAAVGSVRRADAEGAAPGRGDWDRDMHSGGQPALGEPAGRARDLENAAGPQQRSCDRSSTGQRTVSTAAAPSRPAAAAQPARAWGRDQGCAPRPGAVTAPWPTLRTVHLAEWSCSSMSYRARALSHQPRASLLSEHQLAEWLGVTHLDIVMDGVAWR